MWYWEQTNGRLYYDGLLRGTGYSGAGAGKNNPALQWEENIGPIPEGRYNIEEPRDTPAHGPFVMPLSPYPENQMFGRSGFLIHGDSIKKPGTASEGCIILPRTARQEIWNSGDHTLQVVKVIENPVVDLDGEISV